MVHEESDLTRSRSQSGFPAGRRLDVRLVVEMEVTVLRNTNCGGS